MLYSFVNLYSVFLAEMKVRRGLQKIGSGVDDDQ